MAEKQPNIYDVAREAGVSIATVSRALSGKTCSEASARRVREAMERLGWQPARGVSSTGEAPDVFAMVVSGLDHPYYADMVAGAEEAAREAGYALQVYVNGPGQQSEREELLRRLLRQRLAGCLLVGSVIEAGATEEVRQLIGRLQEKLPLVTIGPLPEGLDCVNITSDLTVSVKKSLAYLVSLGHRRIAFIGGDPGERSPSIREHAFLQEMERLGLPCLYAQLSGRGFTPQAGELCVTRLYSGAAPESRPTAIIAINDLVAMGAMRQLRRMGLRIPEDVSIIGCDDQFFATYLEPPLTTVDLHPREHGRSAVEELVAVCRGGARCSFSQIERCSLTVRESCCEAASI